MPAIPAKLKKDLMLLRRRVTCQRDLERMERLWDSYETAMVLANGADPYRGAYWEDKAEGRLVEVRNLFNHLFEGIRIEQSGLPTLEADAGKLSS